MEEIKVGEFVRTKEGKIYKITDYDKEANKYHSIDGKFWYIIFPRDISKHSPNIIDLLEEGDYVNGKEVVYGASESELYNGHKTIGVSISNDNSTTWTILDTEIRDIVTHEQFNQMKYIVGDESNGM